MTQIKVIVTIFGDLLNPKKFGEVIRINPTDYWIKGDAIPNRKSSLTRKETCWEYSFGFIQTLFFDEISTLFLKKFSSNIEEISNYINENQLQAKVDVVVEIVNNEMPSLFLNKKFIDLVLKMNGEIDIDLYYLRD